MEIKKENKNISPRGDDAGKTCPNCGGELWNIPSCGDKFCDNCVTRYDQDMKPRPKRKPEKICPLMSIWHGQYTGEKACLRERCEMWVGFSNECSFHRIADRMLWTWGRE